MARIAASTTSPLSTFLSARATLLTFIKAPAARSAALMVLAGSIKIALIAVTMSIAVALSVVFGRAVDVCDNVWAANSASFALMAALPSSGSAKAAEPLHTVAI